MSEEKASLVSLLRTRRFAPLLAGLCIGALSDNLYRNALVVLVEFSLAAQLGIDGAKLVALAPGLFMLPYFLLSATAGQLADRLDKARWMQTLKLVEIGLMAFAAWALIAGNITGLLTTLVLAGVQSAFYSPVKYAILPQHLRPHELLTGNALVGAGVYLSILLGTIAGGVLILVPYGAVIVSTLLVLLAVVGWLTALAILPAPPLATAKAGSLNPVRATVSTLRTAWSQPTLPLIILGHAWFWFVSALYVGQMPSMVGSVLHGTQGVFTLFFTLFSVGIGVGALLVRGMLKGVLDGRFCMLGSLGMAVCGAALAITLQGFNTDGTPLTLAEFLLLPKGWFAMVQLVLLAICGGVYIVPLNALLQARARADVRAQTIAASNIVDAGGMVAGSVLSALLLGMGLSIPTIWLLVALSGFIAIPVMMTLLPRMMLKQVFQHVLRALFDVQISGLENLEKAGSRAVIVANHVSLLDGLLLATFLPGRPLFAVNSIIAQQWWVKPFLALVEAYKMDATQPMALKGLIARVAEGAHCVIFPEGRITTTGALMKVNEGPGLIADKANAMIVPIRIEGAEYTRFSYLKGMVRRRTFPRLRLTIMPPERFAIPPEVTGRARRALAGQKLYDLMSHLIFTTSNLEETLPEALLEARALHGGGRLVLEDRERRPLSYNRVVTGMMVLGRAFTRFSARGARVGVMLPSTNAAALSLLALQFIGRTPAMINFSSGPASVCASCRAAALTHVITSRQFIAVAKLESLAEAMAQQVTLVYLEDIKASLSLVDKLYGLLGRPLARALHKRYNVSAHEAAVVLFTSGSEGMPKGVVLSHASLLANRWQVGARIDFTPRDVVLNALPLFHSFGLTGGLLIPLLGGARTVLYPSPLHYRIVPLLAYDCNATIMFGTDTFLSGYARTAHPYDFYALRFICAGAEKVKESTRRLYADKYGVRILEGYGATETAPVIAVNTLMHNKAGSVGRLLPGMKAKMAQVPGLTEGRRLYVSGPNIMMGYLKEDAPGVLQPPPLEDGSAWHDTGDIVTMDSEGYLFIIGRAKRFAKVAGEMVPLGGVEAMVERAWPGFVHAVVTLPDERRGEQLILVTTKPDASAADLQAQVQKDGLTELMLPRRIIFMERLPLLGSGKTDYVELQRLVAASH